MKEPQTSQALAPAASATASDDALAGFAYLARTELMLEQNIEAVAQDHSDDPDGFDARIAKMRASWLENFDGAEHDLAARAFDHKAQRHAGLIRARARQRRRREDTADILALYTHALAQAVAGLRAGDRDRAEEEAAKVLASREALLAGAAITMDDYIAMGTRASSEMLRAQLQGEADRALAEGPVAAAEFIETLRADSSLPASALPEDERTRMADELAVRLRHALADQLHRAEAEEAAGAAQLHARQERNFEQILTALENRKMDRLDVDMWQSRRAISARQGAFLRALDLPRNPLDAADSDGAALTELYGHMDGSGTALATGKDKALAMYGDGLISKPDLDRTRAEAAAVGGEGFDARRARRLVTTAVTPRGAPDPASKAQKALLLREFTAQIADGKPPREAARTAVSHLRPGADMAPQSPLYLQGDPSDGAALERARRKTAAAVRAGALSAAAGAREAHLIRQLTANRQGAME